MEVISFFVYFGFMPNNIEYQNISFSENIDYCTNVIHNPNLEDEFYLKCNLKETNKYIMMVKKGIN